MEEIYLDNSATTCVSRAAAAAAMDMMTLAYGNPSSLHSKGVQAEQRLLRARRAVADAVGARPEDITFTSGATEANNLAILGAMQRARRMGGRVVTTAVEHSSVLDAFGELARQGCEVISVAPDAYGRVAAADVLAAMDARTVLVSMMLVNNEVGAVMPVQELTRAARRRYPDCLFHCDAVQALGKRSVRVKDLDVDLLTVSGHKIHAPKGVGALYLRRGLHLAPRQFGGHQEGGLRPGTEPTALIAAFGAAASELDPAGMQCHCAALRTRLLEGAGQIPGAAVLSPADGTPAVCNISILGVRSEIMIHFLEEQGIYVSSGSACARGEKSHVLRAMGLPDSRIDSALRISFCKQNTVQDIDTLLQALAAGRARFAPPHERPLEKP